MIVLTVELVGGRTVVTVAPITHTSPERPDLAVEIPSATRQRLGLDGERSWIVAADLNRFVWPGVDLRPVARDSRNYAYGLFPAGLYRAVRDRVLDLARLGQAKAANRSE